MSGDRASGGDDRVELNAGYILPGGKVDPEAILRAIDDARSQGVDEDDAELRRLVFTLSHDLGKRLDRYLTDRITFMSRTQLQRLIDGGGVLVNGATPKASTRLGKGDVVEVVVPPPPSREIQPEEIPLDVMYEDDDLIVINKPPDIITHPARSHLRGTLINALAWRFRHVSGGALSTVGGEFARPGVVHRLDRNTSGVQVFAKRDEAHWKLGHQFEHRRVEKRYLAIVHGRPIPPADAVDLPIGPHPSREKGYREMYVVRHDHLGKPALTLYRTREVYGPAGSPRDPSARSDRPTHRLADGALDGFALVELDLKTGRTHQIRVHLSHLGWPIVGDDMYGGGAYIGPDLQITRQALHAATIAFEHPTTGAAMRFTAPLRAELAALVKQLRSRAGFELLPSPGATVDLGAVIP